MIKKKGRDKKKIESLNLIVENIILLRKFQAVHMPQCTNAPHCNDVYSLWTDEQNTQNTYCKYIAHCVSIHTDFGKCKSTLYDYD